MEEGEAEGPKKSGNNFMDLIVKRKSVRSFAETNLSDLDVNYLLDAANFAPSAGNLQAYEIVVVKEEKRKEELSKASHAQKAIRQAPVVFCFVVNPKRNEFRYKTRGKLLYTLQDATIAASYLQLAATSIGLASVWIGAFHDEIVDEVLELEEAMSTVAIIPVGYESGEGKEKERSRRNTVLYKIL